MVSIAMLVCWRAYHHNPSYILIDPIKSQFLLVYPFTPPRIIKGPIPPSCTKSGTVSSAGWPLKERLGSGNQAVEVDHWVTVPIYQWIDLRENLQENPIFNGEIHGFLQIFP